MNSSITAQIHTVADFKHAEKTTRLVSHRCVSGGILWPNAVTAHHPTPLYSKVKVSRKRTDMKNMFQ